MRLSSPSSQVPNMLEHTSVREPKKNVDTFCKISCPRNTNNHCYAVNNGLSASSQDFSKN